MHKALDATIEDGNPGAVALKHNERGAAGNGFPRCGHARLLVHLGVIGIDHHFVLRARGSEGEGGEHHKRAKEWDETHANLHDEVRDSEYRGPHYGFTLRL